MRAPRWQRVLRLVRVPVTLTLVVFALYLLQDRLPNWSAVLAALEAADTMWLAVALGAEILSMAMFARQQRRLLTAFGVPISLPRAGLITWSRSAIAISMPAGTALSAGWAFRQFRASGASQATAAAVMVLSGMVSFLALAGLYLTGLLAGLVAPLTGHSPQALAGVGLATSATVIAIGLAINRFTRRTPSPPPAFSTLTSTTTELAGPVGSADLGVVPGPPRWPWLAATIATTTARLAEVRASAREVQGRHWALAFAAASFNWLADLACLAAVARAFDLPVSLAHLGLAYLAVQVVRQVPLTPGGVGVIEASLLAGLMTAGAPQATAAATVVVYRLLSCWLVIPVGALAWAGLRRHTPTSLHTPLPAPPPIP